MKHTLRDRLYLGLYHLFRWLVTHTPERILFPVLKGIARLLYLLDGKHRRVARVNLDLAFGDTMSDEEKTRIVKKTYENLVFNLAHSIAHQDDTPEEILEYVTFENGHYIKEALKKGPIIAITAHYGNWELIPKAIVSAFDVPITIVGRPLDSPAMDELLKRSRERLGVKLLPKKGAMKGMIASLKKGEPVGLLVDQNTTRGEGVEIRFFGKKARQTVAAALLGRRFDATIIPMFIRTDANGKYRLHVYPPLKTPKTDDPKEDIRRSVQQQADVIEEAIREKPDEWFWLHKRWKAFHKQAYESTR